MTACQRSACRAKTISDEARQPITIEGETAASSCSTSLGRIPSQRMATTIAASPASNPPMARTARFATDGDVDVASARRSSTRSP